MPTLLRRGLVGVCIWPAVATVLAAAPPPGAADPRFTLRSAAAPTVTARIAAHLTRCCDRYQLVWPPQPAAQPGAKPTPIQVELFGTLDDYRSALAARRLKLSNPACFIADENIVLLGFDGARFGGQLDALQKRTAALTDALASLRTAHADRVKEDEERFRLQGTPPAVRKDLKQRRLQEFNKAESKARQALAEAEQANAGEFDRLARDLLAAAAHEMFHAYVHHRVYTPERGQLPRWLDEGMAQVVEHAAWRDNRLPPEPPVELVRRVKAAHQAAAKERVAAFDLIAVLDAGSDDFRAVADSGSDDGAQARNYLAAWCLTQFLLSSGDLKPGEALDRYVADRRTPPKARFERWLGRSTTDVEQQWRAWIERL